MNTTPTTNDWNNLFPTPLGEREADPRTLRFPKELAAGIEELAKELGQDFTTVTLHLLRAALSEVKARGGSKKRASKKA